MDDESRKFTELYRSLMKGDKSKVMEKYAELRQSSGEALSIYGDTILHMAIYMGQESIAREILMRHNPPLTKQNALGDTILHEAAAANMTSLAKDLLILGPNLLSIQNKNEETPLFRAAHFGHTEMFELLAELVRKKGEADWLHWTNKVGSTILHMAILSEFFDLALKIAMKYPDLVNKEDGDRMKGLQLLSYNSSAFRSGRKYGLLKRFIYYCIPSEDIVVKEDSPRRKGPELPPMHIICLHFYFTVVHALTSETLPHRVGQPGNSVWAQRHYLTEWALTKTLGI
uniref:Uncharacterized protein n=1 Tax=Quercus lobata TaxID=97700 RepID=A0A7N2LTG7_QUELO